jgi:hypothetical protein
MPEGSEQKWCRYQSKQRNGARFPNGRQCPAIRIFRNLRFARGFVVGIDERDVSNNQWCVVTWRGVGSGGHKCSNAQTTYSENAVRASCKPPRFHHGKFRRKTTKKTKMRQRTAAAAHHIHWIGAFFTPPSNSSATNFS